MGQLAGAGPTHPSQTSGDIRVVVSATFTAEPIEPYLRFWLGRLGLAGRIEFADYNQVFQQLLDPNSAFARNASGVNLVLVRVEDWVRFKPDGWDEAALATAADEFARAVQTFAERVATPTIVCATPPSAAVAQTPGRATVVRQLEDRLRQRTAPFGSVHWLGAAAYAPYPVPAPLDEAGDRIGHIPYTPALFAAVSTAVARRVHAIKFAAHKVIALDCDNTLWGGVVGEDGPQGIRLGPGAKALQEFVVARQAAGMLVCLVSKNAEADVLAAFEARPDFPLRREHLTSWRINWVPKSRSLVELADELNVGLDSFIFLDDNPIECAEVRAALPQVLTLQVPGDEDIAELLPHVWAFDRLSVTDEDRKRTVMYQQNAARARLQQEAGDIGAFLASLGLTVRIAPPADGQWARVAQLTQKTNQFNFTTVRRTEAEIRQCGRAGLDCLCVEVSDRFGEYGLVGVMVFGAGGDDLVVDTFLLSCRVLGRGVEHAMLAHLGRTAADRGRGAVVARFVPTAKNEPAARFLRSVATEYAVPSAAGEGAGSTFRIPAAVAAAAEYRPGDDANDQLALARTEGKPAAGAAATAGTVFDKSSFYAEAATTLRHAEAVLRRAEEACRTPRALATPLAEPTSALQRELADMWGRLLNVAPVGIDDDFGLLGGTSLQCARLFAGIESNYGVRLPMSTILETPTVRTLADRLASANRTGSRQSLKLLRAGKDGGPALFLVHDGDGETLLYLNLARRLPDDVAVYGLEPLGTDRCPMLHTSIPEMAAHYIDRVREVRPAGPYLLGGLCAGGVIAFEMGLQLRAAGQPVGLVILLDAADARAKGKPYLGLRRRLARFSQALRGQTPAAAGPGAAGSDVTPGTAAGPSRAPGGRLKRLVRTALTKLANVVRYEVTEYKRRVARAAKIRTLRATAGGPAADRIDLTVRDLYEHAEQGYAPATRLDAATLLIRAGGDGKDYTADEPLLARLRDPDFGWGRRLAAGRPLEILDAPGGHGGMLQEPHVAVVAGHVRTALERVAHYGRTDTARHARVSLAGVGANGAAELAPTEEVS
jgi:FkbH-like protein